VQNDTLVSTCPLLETSLLWYERIVDVQRNVQKASLTKLNYQQTDGTEKHKKDKTNTVWTKLQMENFLKTKIVWMNKYLKTQAPYEQTFRCRKQKRWTVSLCWKQLRLTQYEWTRVRRKVQKTRLTQYEQTDGWRNVKETRLMSYERLLSYRET